MPVAAIDQPPSRRSAACLRHRRAGARGPGRWAARAAARALLAVLLAAVGGCGDLPETQPDIGRADLVNELADRLAAAERLTYSADYQLPAGRAAQLAQDPPRVAYAYPGGSLIVTAAAVTECRAGTCQVTAPPGAGSAPAAELFREPGAGGFVPPGVVTALLSAAALDPEAVVRQHDTTVAGLHATCVSVRGVENAAAASFDACVTTAGVLGSFTGTIGGRDVELTLTRYREDVGAAAFTAPAGARVVDRRPGAATRTD